VTSPIHNGEIIEIKQKQYAPVHESDRELLKRCFERIHQGEQLLDRAVEQLEDPLRTEIMFALDCWDGRMRHAESPARYRQFYEAAPKTCSERPLGRLGFVDAQGLTLDIGCHDGQGLRQFSGAATYIVGVDIAKTALDACRAWLGGTIGEASLGLVQAWAEACPFRDGVFDTVVLTEVLEHVIDPEPVIREAARVLKPKGRIFITAPEKRRGNFAHVRGLDRAAMAKLLELAGLKALEWPSVGHYTSVVAKKEVPAA
jgi:SAM-dependent methyltransferase